MSELDKVMEKIGSSFSIETVPLKIGDKVLKIVQIKDYEEYILDQIDAVDYDVFNHRPGLGAFDWPRILFKAALP